MPSIRITTGIHMVQVIPIMTRLIPGLLHRMISIPLNATIWNAVLSPPMLLLSWLRQTTAFGLLFRKLMSSQVLC